MTIAHNPDPDVHAKMEWETEYGRAGTMRAGDPLAVHRYRLIIVDKGQNGQLWMCLRRPLGIGRSSWEDGDLLKERSSGRVGSCRFPTIISVT